VANKEKQGIETKPRETKVKLNRRQQRGHSLKVAVVVVVVVIFVVVAAVAIDIGAQMNFIKNCNKHCRQLKKLKATDRRCPCPCRCPFQCWCCLWCLGIGDELRDERRPTLKWLNSARFSFSRVSHYF